MPQVLNTSQPVTYRERFLRLDGAVTRFIEVGEQGAPTMMLLHDGAWGGASDVTWGGVLPLLADGFHVIAPDFLGFGGSDKTTSFDRSSYEPRIRQVEALLDALMVDDLHVVGSSYGGSVALRMLTESTVQPRSVVSIGGTGGPWKTDTMVRELGRWDGTREDLARVLAFLMDDTHPDFAVQLTRRLHWASMPGHYRSVASAALPLPDVLKQKADDAWPAELAEVRAPTLLVAGRDDALFAPDWPERIQEHLPHAEIARMDTRHSPNLDHPRAVVENVTGFIGSVPTGGGLDRRASRPETLDIKLN